MAPPLPRLRSATEPALGADRNLGRPAVFLDKDGTLVEDIPYNVDTALLSLTPNAAEGLRLLSELGFVLIVVSNQPGIALQRFDRAALASLQIGLTDLLASHGVAITDFFFCPHAPATRRLLGCLCRKPAPGLLRQAAGVHRIDLQRSWMIGDILDDIEAGRRAGCRTVMLDVGNETEWHLSPMRTPHKRAANLLEAAHWIRQVREDGTTPVQQHQHELPTLRRQSPAGQRRPRRGATPHEV